MPKYELMYILSSAVSDNDVPAIASEVDKFIQEQGGSILQKEMIGKKKLAYPIKKTRNGFYVLETFNFEGLKISGLDNKLRSLEPIIRYLIVNLEEYDRRLEKDAKIQEKMRGNRKQMAPQETEKQPLPVQLTETELEEKIQEALGSEDLAK